MKKGRIKIQPLVVAATIFVCGLNADIARAQSSGEDHMVVLVDMSGSMHTTRSNDSRTRIEVARELARTQITRAKGLYSLKGVAVYAFYEEEVVLQTNTTASGFVVPEKARDAIEELKNTRGMTPLAMSVCDVVDRLVEVTNNGSGRRILHLLSDGEENNTPSGHPCYGKPSVSLVGDYDIGSWHRNIKDKIEINRIETSMDLFDFSAITGNSSKGNSSSSAGLNSASNGGPNFHDFMQDLAEDSGGKFRLIRDDEPIPIRGDVNKDYVINIWDVFELERHIGYPAIEAEQGCDLNNDLFVDEQDLNILDSIVFDNSFPTINGF